MQKYSFNLKNLFSDSTFAKLNHSLKKPETTPWILSSPQHNVKISKNWDTKINHCSGLKTETVWFYNAECFKNADGMANSISPNQTAPLGSE